MAHWRKLLVAGVGALSLIGAATVSVAADEGGNLIEFNSMTPVTGAALFPATDRGIPGGGFPWKIASASGSVGQQGDVSVTVRGLVLVPTSGNPVSPFQAELSCLNAHGVPVNVPAGSAAADHGGNSSITAMITVPRPCLHPELFVGGSPFGTFLWFARSNIEVDEN
jgi:hypothetical protein